MTGGLIECGHQILEYQDTLANPQIGRISNGAGYTGKIANKIARI